MSSDFRVFLFKLCLYFFKNQNRFRLNGHNHISGKKRQNSKWSKDSENLVFRANFKNYSTTKRASRATALRADGEWHTRGLVLTPWTSPNPWTWP